MEVREWDIPRVESVAAELGLAIPDFVSEALKRRKWAFAADWVRFLALYHDGGVYFDYDFELVKPIDRILNDGEFVAGQWLPDGSIGMEPAIISLERRSAIARAMLDYYASAKFDGHITVGEILAKVIGPGKIRILKPEIFSPIDARGICHATESTIGIHHYAMGWVDPWHKLLKWLSWHGGRGIVDAAVTFKHFLKGGAR